MNRNKILGNLNKKDTLIESEIPKMSRKELIDLTNKLLSKHSALENRFNKLEALVMSMKEDYKKQDEVIEGTKKTANAILLILDNKEIKESGVTNKK